MKRLALALLIPMAALAQEAGKPLNPYWADSWRGWHFYEEPPPPPPVRREAEGKRTPELQALERLQEEAKRTRAIAVMNPTVAHVRRYMEVERQIAELASAFSEVARRVAWTHPYLDPTLNGRPANAKALQVFEEQEQQDRARIVSTLAGTHVLFFFFRGDCPYCHAFAPTLAAFEKRFGLRVVPVSLDGGALPDFRTPRQDNGIARTLKVSQVPAIFLAQPFTGQIAPIGVGVLSESQLLERIAVLSGANPEVSQSTTLTALPEAP